MRRSDRGKKHQKRLPGGRHRVLLGVLVSPRAAVTLRKMSEDEAASVSMLLAQWLEQGLQEMEKWTSSKRR